VKISRETKISELIEAYPFLIDELEKINSTFGLLKDKAARTAMGGSATIGTAASVASMSVEDLLAALQRIITEHGGAPLEIEDEDHRRKLETLKQIIRDMHAEGDSDKARKKFNELIKGIEPDEIKDLEQQLVMEGMPVAEIQRLCDLHAGIFKDVLGESCDVEVPEGHPVHTYRMENHLIEKAIRDAEQSLAGLDADRLRKVKPALREAFSRIAHVEKHYVRKENQLFPFMEKRGITAPTQVMWGVHDEIRGLIKQAAAALDTADHKKILKAMTALNHAVTEMIFKDEKILFPMVLQNLTPEDWDAIRRGEDELGYILGVTPGAPLKQKTGAAATADKDALPLDTGKMTLKQINAMLKHLPLDVSFVNTEDEVMYYSDTKERFFPRSPAVIGRKVQHCHPPKSVHVVQQIVDAFRSGKKDSADFWINLRGRTVYIRYFAVRDDAGAYLGTLEVSQDITEIQRLKGERRLLDWEEEKGT
jgi:DUF438 domain-containing protein